MISDKVIKISEKTMKNWRAELTAWGKKVRWGENPGDIPGRCVITITICDSDDATESHT